MVIEPGLTSSAMSVIFSFFAFLDSVFLSTPRNFAACWPEALRSPSRPPALSTRTASPPLGPGRYLPTSSPRHGSSRHEHVQTRAAAPRPGPRAPQRVKLSQSLRRRPTSLVPATRCCARRGLPGIEQSTTLRPRRPGRTRRGSGGCRKMCCKVVVFGRRNHLWRGTVCGTAHQITRHAECHQCNKRRHRCSQGVRGQEACLS